MVENRPEHEQAAEPAEHRQPTAQETGALSGETETEPTAGATPDAEPARGPEQAFDIAADQREQAEQSAGLPEPEFATTTAAADATASAQSSAPPRSSLASLILPPVLTIAIATGLVVGAAKMGLLPQFLSSTSVTAPQTDPAALDALNARIAKLEATPAAGGAAAAPSDSAALEALAIRITNLEQRPQAASGGAATPDPAASSRIDTLEKTVASLRDDLTALRGRTDQLAATVNELKPAPAGGGTTEDSKPNASVDADKSAALEQTTAALAAIDRRLDSLETAAKVQAEKPARTPAPAEDSALRRAVAATLLDLSVTQGHPFEALLKAASPLAPDPAALKPLDQFAAAGVPSAKALGQELIDLLPKLLPEKIGANANFIDRFQANAERLVKIQRSDAVEGIDRTAIIGRLTAAGKQGDIAGALKELKALAPGDRAPVQSWIDKAEARDQALAASRQFATSALVALQKPSP
ncbi:COG4223 family protein [Rhodopseudomonas parapalustris]